MIQNAKRRSFSEVNKLLIDLYWSIGEYVSNKIKNKGWGKSTVKELSEYILKHEPGIKGYSTQNIWRMKQFYETYKNYPKLSPLVREISWTKNLHIISIDDFKPEYLGKMEFYLEALDRDVKKDSENPSVGIILCKNADSYVVEYALSRSLSKTMIAKYKTNLISKEVLLNKLKELYNINT